MLEVFTVSEVFAASCGIPFLNARFGRRSFACVDRLIGHGDEGKLHCEIELVEYADRDGRSSSPTA